MEKTGDGFLGDGAFGGYQGTLQEYTGKAAEG